jgi:hypothetical protein
VPIAFIILPIASPVLLTLRALCLLGAVDSPDKVGLFMKAVDFMRRTLLRGMMIKKE